MKKSLIIVLLTALVLCAFTACDGDVNADLSGGKRTITLVIDDSITDWKFDDNTTTKTVEIPSDCKTWKDLADAEFSIKVVYQLVPEEYEILIKDGTDVYGSPTQEHGKAHFAVYYAGHWVDCSGIKPVSKAYYPEYQSYVGINENITIGGTYKLTQESYYL